MAYVSKNFKSKKDLKAAIAAGEKLSVNHGLMHGQNSADENYNGDLFLEGPWYPQAHTWYAKVKMVEGYIEKVAA